MNLPELLASQRKGALIAEAQDKLSSVVKACIATGKPGSITIKLKIRQGDEDSVVIEDEIKQNAPEKSKHGCSFFCDENGLLYRDNPKQPELPAVVQAMAANE